MSDSWQRVVSEEGVHGFQWSEDRNEAVVWREDGNHWKMHFTQDGDEPLHVDLGHTRSVRKALNRADDVIGMYYALPAPEPEQHRPRHEEETYVLQINNPNGNGNLYMSRDGMENDAAPIWDTLDKAAITNERSAHGFAEWFKPPPPGLRSVPEREARARDDLQNVINLANEVDDRTPEEQASLDRLSQQIDWQSFDRTDGNGYQR